MQIKSIFLAIPKKIINALELDDTIPNGYFLGIFLSVLVIRNFIEAFSQRDYNYLNADNQNFILGQLHGNLSIISGAIALVILFHFATRVEIIKIIRVVAPCFIILLITPLLDLIISFGHGFNIMYLGAVPSKNLIQLFFGFFYPYPGVTPGMKIEIALALYLCFSYFIIKGRQVFFSLVYTIMVYALIFIYCAAPLIVKFILFHLGMDYQFSAILMLRFYLVITVFLGLLLAFLTNKTICIAIFRDMRWSRISHYIAMLAFGCAIALHAQNHVSLSEVFHSKPMVACNFFFAMMGILFAALFSIVTNNIADYSIDEISNPTRPLIAKKIPMELYKKIGMAAFFLACLYGAAAGFKILFIITMVMGTYFIYSMPPIRFKRIPIFSKLIISINSLAIVLAGYLLIKDVPADFPKLLIPIFLIGFTLAANFVDIKDLKGDQIANIRTLPGLIGIKATQYIVSLGFVSIYFSFYYILPNIYILYFLLTGAVAQIYIIFQKTCDERYIFGVYLIYLIIFIGLLF